VVSDMDSSLQVDTMSHQQELNISNSAFRTCQISKSIRLTCYCRLNTFLYVRWRLNSNWKHSARE